MSRRLTFCQDCNRLIQAMWRWMLRTQTDLRRLIPQILPYLTGKRAKAQEMLDALS